MSFKPLKPLKPLKHIPRMTGWILTALLLVIAIGLVSPQQLPVALYKLSLISLAVVVAYWLDRSLFPYARPDSYLKQCWRSKKAEGNPEAPNKVAEGCHRVFAAAMLRRAIIVGAVVIGVATGL
ncbi:MAG: putative holin [Azovibrio sp.]